MKNIFILLITVCSFTLSVAQNGFHYKALIKNAADEVVANQAVTIQFQILADGTTNVYQETHTPTTDANGIIIINIGEGTPDSGDFTTIDWASTTHFLNVQLDVDDGTGLIDLGTTQFKSVPYAKVAERVLRSTTSSLLFPNGFEGKQPITAGGSNYSVPAGKNLYITNFALLDMENITANDLTITANGGAQIPIMTDRTNGFQWVSHVPAPIIVGENENVIIPTNGSINGFLVDNNGVTPVAKQFASSGDVYTVPMGKQLHILTLNSEINISEAAVLQAQNLNINGITVYVGSGNSAITGSKNLVMNTNPFNPFMAAAGDSVSGSGGMVITGYLIDE